MCYVMKESHTLVRQANPFTVNAHTPLQIPTVATGDSSLTTSTFRIEHHRVKSKCGSNGNIVDR